MLPRRLLRALAPLLLLFGCLGPPSATDTAVSATLTQLYEPRSGTWAEPDRPPEVGDELLQDGHLVRFTSTGVEDRGPVTVDDLAHADLTYDADRPRLLPVPWDWVLVLGDHDDAGHQRLDHVTPGDRFGWLGRIHDTRATNRGLEVRVTGDVLARVTNTFSRQSPEVIDAVIAYDDGTEDRLSGTPNHPFWVPAVGDYMPLGELEVGAQLHVSGGGEAVLVSATWRQGDFEVFDFEVEGVHNFYVHGPGSGAAGVLVHNSVADESVDLFRAVSPDEFDDIMSTGQFRTSERSLSAKQFGMDLDEVVELADDLPGASAVVRARVPRSTVDALDHTPVDRHVLRSGSVTVHEGEPLDLLNATLETVDHAY